MLTPWVLRIIFLNVAMFGVQVLAQTRAPELIPLLQNLVLVPRDIPYEPWTLVTYMFLHAGIGHIFFNMLSLYFFGPRLELQLGGRRFLTLYFLSGIAGGLLSWPFSPDVSVVGASGAIFGVMAGFAWFWPREQIFMMFAVLEARWAIVVFAVIDLFGGLGGGDNIAHFAHLGGAGASLAYLWLGSRFSMRRKADTKPRAPRISRGDLSRWARIQRETLHEVNREEYDRIMKKIDDEGIGSVTSREREFLDTFSDRAGPLH